MYYIIPDARARRVAGMRVLDGDGTYDELSEREQATVRAEWDQRITQRREGLDLEAEFTAAGQSWSESDDDGSLIIRGASR